MDRRKSLQTMILGAGAFSLGIHSCSDKTETEIEQQIVAVSNDYFGRTPEELARINALHEEQLFNEHELQTIEILANVILPPKAPYGGPSDAGVPAFIEFIGKDVPSLQNTLLGGLMWLDHQANSQYNTSFKTATLSQQKTILDPIAYHDPELPLSKQPLEIQFFNLMRNLTVCGYYTSEVGIKDLGYKGNTPNVWDGVPQEVLDQHGVAYDPKWIAKCIDQSKRGVIAEWDDKGNLLT